MSGVALLERSITYALGVLHDVRPGHLGRATPCHDWNLADLLRHLDDSLGALAEAVTGRVALTDSVSRTDDLVLGVRDRARTVLGIWSSAPRSAVSVGNATLPAGIVAGTGAVEIAVHGWDVAQACGLDRPVPDPLAMQLLGLLPLLVTRADREGRFAAAVTVAALVPPSERLVALLGRRALTSAE